MGNIYSAPSSVGFMERALCLADQYSEYDVPFTVGPATVSNLYIDIVLVFFITRFISWTAHRCIYF